MSHLDYSSNLLVQTTDKAITKMQHVENVAARMVLKSAQ